MRRPGLVVVAPTLLWLAAMALVAKQAVDRLEVQPWGNVVADARSLPVGAQTVVGQVFQAPYPGLYRIDIWLEGGTGSAAGTVTLRERAGSEAVAVLQSNSFGPDDLQEGMPYSVTFDPLRASSGREYTISLESSAAPENSAFAVAYGPGTVLQGATATLNGAPVQGSLKFLTYYTLRTRDKLDLLLARMAQGRPYLLGAKGFYIGLAIVCALLLALFLWQIAALVTGDRRGDR